MKFRKKMIISFSIVVLLISFFGGAIYYTYSSRKLTESTRQRMQVLSNQIAVSLDDTMESMKQVSDYMLSDMDMLNAMKLLSMEKIQRDAVERKNCLATITSGITTDYNIKNFYRVVYFNETGDVTSSTQSGSTLVDKNTNVSEFPWLEQAAALHGKAFLLSPRPEQWGSKNKETVISMVRKVQGGDFGYIEVQKTAASINENLAKLAEGTEMAVFFPDGVPLYRTDQLKDMETLWQAVKETGTEYSGELLLGQRNMLFSVGKSPVYHICVVMLEDVKTGNSEMRNIIDATILLVAGVFFVALMMVVLISNRLTASVRALKELMEHTNLENLGETPVFETSEDEIAALGKSYKNMTNRLNEAIEKEKKLSFLQLQAQFDTLQAQVNPHFLYNMLNVISNRGIINRDERICEICGSLAAMLRYSTNTKNRYATVAEEMDYLDQYIFLQKSRYEHKLEYESSCEPEILEEVLPKIVLQQLVENCLQHGFCKKTSVMRIQVRGFRCGHGWRFEVEDNGQGISEEVIRELEEKLRRVREKILTRHSNIELEIGGMGLVNIYARMFLMYKEKMIFKIANQEEGMRFTLGVSDKEEGFCIYDRP